jgi:ADP-ribose pyrophosphatase
MVAMSASDASPARDGAAHDGEARDGAALARIPWKTVSSRPIYANPWIRVREDLAELPDGRTTIYGVVECAGAVGILPFIDPDTVLLVGQYRYVVGDFYWEMPTGAAHAGEPLETTAQRELAEEAGYEAGRLVALGSFHTSKSILHEVAHLFLAEDLRPASRPPDPTEFIERRAFAFAEALAMVERGEIKDSMTIVAVLRAARLRGR